MSEQKEVTPLSDEQPKEPAVAHAIGEAFLTAFRKLIDLIPSPAPPPSPVEPATEPKSAPPGAIISYDEIEVCRTFFAHEYSKPELGHLALFALVRNTMRTMGALTHLGWIHPQPDSWEHKITEAESVYAALAHLKTRGPDIQFPVTLKPANINRQLGKPIACSSKAHSVDERRRRWWIASIGGPDLYVSFDEPATLLHFYEYASQWLALHAIP